MCGWWGLLGQEWELRAGQGPWHRASYLLATVLRRGLGHPEGWIFLLSLGMFPFGVGPTNGYLALYH